MSAACIYFLKMKLLVVNLLLAWTAYAQVDPIYSGPCTLPDGKTEGKCSQIRYCPKVLHRLRRLGPLVIKPYLCNGGSRKVMVCCSDEDSLLPSQPNCGQSFNLRIAGGTNATAGDYPWAALILYDDGVTTSWGCGATLINSRYVLTAAHCVDKSIIGNKHKVSLIRLGENNLDTLLDSESQTSDDIPQDIEPEEIIIHPKFSLERLPVLVHDVALLRLKIPVKYTEFVRPVCLPDEDEEKERVGSAVVIGWGFIGSKTEQTSILQRLFVPLVSLSECTSRYDRRSRNTPIVLSSNYHLCAGGEVGKDSCRGDSGGSLLQANSNGIYTQIGVVSFGATNCSNSDLPGVYTKVVNYISWIKLHLRP